MDFPKDETSTVSALGKEVEVILGYLSVYLDTGLNWDNAALYEQAE